MDSTYILVVIVFIVALLAYDYLIDFFIKNHQKVNGEELKKLHPELGSLKFKYIAIKIIVVLAACFISFKVHEYDTRLNLLIFPVVYSSMILYDGIFSLITGVHPVNKRIDLVQFVYDNDKNLQWIALLRIGIAIFVGVICVVIIQSSNR
jgi:hypothetical protein